jgi:hypothetical protein
MRVSKAYLLGILLFIFIPSAPYLDNYYNSSLISRKWENANGATTNMKPIKEND